jgi:hypothetical protein
MTTEDAEGTLEWGGRARELAERLDDAEVLVYALTNITRSQAIREAARLGLPRQDS